MSNAAATGTAIYNCYTCGYVGDESRCHCMGVPGRAGVLPRAAESERILRSAWRAAFVAWAFAVTSFLFMVAAVLDG